MKLDELHVGDHRSGPPSHRDAVAGRDRRDSSCKGRPSRTTGGKEQPIGPNRFHHPGNFIENVNAQAMVFSRKPKFRGGDQIDCHVIFEQLDVWRLLHCSKQCRLDFVTGEIVHVEDTPFRVATFATEIQFAMPFDIALVEVQPKLHQFSHSLGTFPDHRLDRSWSSQSPAPAVERVANVKLEGIFTARYAGHAALGPRGVGIHAFALGHNRNTPVPGRFDRKGQTGNAAADNDEIELFHPRRTLSIRRVLPKKTATASSDRDSIVRHGCRSSALTISA